MGVVQSSIENLKVPEDAAAQLHSQQSRQDIAEALLSIVTAIVDLGKRVAVLEHPGSSPALVDLSVDIDRINKEIAVASEIVSKAPTDAARLRLAAAQAALAAAQQSAGEAIFTPAPVPDHIAVLKQLVAPAAPAETSESPTPAA